MSAVDHQAAVAALRQRHADGQSKLKTDLIAGTDTGPTRAEIAEFARRIEAEVAAWHLDAETLRRVRHSSNQKLVESICGDIAANIEKQMLPLAIPAPIVEPQL